MTALRVVQVGVHALPDTLFVIDVERRTYLGLSRDGTYWHVVRPLRADDYRVREGQGEVGQLTCDCIGAQTHGQCHRVKEAMALEDAKAGPSWLREPAAETELERAAARG